MEKVQAGHASLADRAMAIWTALDSFELHDALPLGHLVVLAVAPLLYLAVLWLLTRVMRRRAAGFRLRTPAIVHNALLCLVSLVMSVGVLAELVRMRLAAPSRGFFWISILCMPPGLAMRGRVYFWAYVFWLSKWWELLDSVFIALRRSKPLTFLHVFHHAVMIFVPYVWMMSRCNWIVLVALYNASVHVLMYGYFVAVGLGHRCAWLRPYITLIQITQFITAFVFLCAQFAVQTFGHRICAASPWVVNMTFALNIVFLALFTHFYLRAYKRGSGRVGSGRVVDAVAAAGAYASEGESEAPRSPRLALASAPPKSGTAAEAASELEMDAGHASCKHVRTRNTRRPAQDPRDRRGRDGSSDEADTEGDADGCAEEGMGDSTGMGLCRGCGGSREKAGRSAVGSFGTSDRVGSEVCCIGGAADSIAENLVRAATEDVNSEPLQAPAEDDVVRTTAGDDKGDGSHTDGTVGGATSSGSAHALMRGAALAAPSGTRTASAPAVESEKPGLEHRESAVACLSSG